MCDKIKCGDYIEKKNTKMYLLHNMFSFSCNETVSDTVFNYFQQVLMIKGMCNKTDCKTREIFCR